MKPKTESDTALPMVIGVDIGKEVFHLVGFGVDGKIVFRRKIKRLGFAAAFEKVPPCIIGMEACLSTHFVSRTLRTLGHEPRIIPAIYVKPFAKGQKNDYNDGEAIAEAALRPASGAERGLRVSVRRYSLVIGCRCVWLSEHRKDRKISLVERSDEILQRSAQANWSSSAFASFRSAVPKPSVNQP
jgi:hypothetical protein